MRRIERLVEQRHEITRLVDGPPPQALEAEMSVLGAMLLDRSVVPSVTAVLQGPADFYKPAHQAVYVKLLELYRAGKPLDLVLLRQTLHDAGLLEGVGGIEYLTSLVESVPSAASAHYHAGLIRDKAAKRELIDALGKNLLRAYTDSASAAELIAAAQAAVEIPHEGLGQYAPQMVGVCMADVPREPIKWVWPGWIPVGLTIMGGCGGLGKGVICADLAARISTGKPFPHEPGPGHPPGDVLFVTAEDPEKSVLGPRLDAALADSRRIHSYKMVRTINPRTGKPAQRFFTIQDLGLFEQCVQSLPGLRCAIIDPLGAFLGKVDSHVYAEVLGALAPLAEVAERYGLAIVAVTHFNKGHGPASDRFMGSVGFHTSARMAIVVTKDPQDPTGRRRLFLRSKTNLGAEGSGLAYSIAGAANDAPHVEWSADEVQETADQALADPPPQAPGPEADQRRRAEDFLRAYLAAGPVLSTDLAAAAEARDISLGTLRRAKDELRVETYRSNPAEHSPWYTRWPAPMPAPSQPEHLGHLA